MKDPGIQDALRTLEPDEIEAIERFVHRLRDEGLLGLAAADRWQAALERLARRAPLRHAQG